MRRSSDNATFCHLRSSAFSRFSSMFSSYTEKIVPIPFIQRSKTESGVRKLYWFADKTFIGACDAKAVLCWKPAPGVYQLTALDDHGRSGSRSVTLR